MTVNSQSPNIPVWDDLTWQPLAAQSSDLTADVCVIGLGGSGLTAVSELLAIGRRVVGIDASDVAAGAAGRNGGFLLGGTADFHHDAVTAVGHARALRIHQLTLQEIRRIAEQAPGTVRFPGSLRIAESDEEFADCARQRDAMRADSIPVEDYEGRFGRGLFFPGDAAFNPLARCRALALDNIAGGARLFARTRALSFSASEVVTEHGRIRCEKVIVAVDGRLESLVPELAGTVRTARLQMLATAPTREIEVPCPVYARYGFDYYQQLPDGCVALGGGRDKAVDDEWTANSEPSAFIQAYLERVLREKLGVKAPVTHRWAANVSYTFNGLPVLAEVRPGVWVIGGYSGTGNAVGALCGRAAAQLANGGTTEFARLLLNSNTGDAPMIDVTVDRDKIVFEVEGWDKLWALRSRLAIPISHIKGARIDGDATKGWWKGVRIGGAQIPGVITAGTFYTKGRLVFYDAHKSEQTIVVDLDHENYDALILQVRDPAAALKLIAAATSNRA